MENGGQVAGMPFVRYLDMPAGSFTIEAGVPTTEKMNPAGEVGTGDLPGGEIAVGDHFGPYDTLGQAHEAMASYIAEQGRAPGGPPWETYVTDPGEEPDQRKWHTEVCYPLA
jgi:AraC family transcriptional regulator